MTSAEGWPDQPVIYEVDTWPWLTDLSAPPGGPSPSPTCRPRPGTPSCRRAWTRCGSWASGSAARRDGDRRAGPGLTASFRAALPDLRARTWWSRTACGATSVDERLGGPARSGRRPRGAAATWRPAPPRPRAQSRRARPSLGPRAPRTVRPRHARRPRANTRRRGSTPTARSSPAAVTRTSRRGRTSCSSTPSRRYPRGDRPDPDRHRRPVRRRPVRHGDAPAERRLRLDLGRPGRRPARRRVLARVLAAVRAQHPGMLFVAEAYWDLEHELQQLGFDACYDKRLYDRLVHEGAASVRAHLGRTSATSAGWCDSPRTTTSPGRRARSRLNARARQRGRRDPPGRDPVARGPVRGAARAPAGVPGRRPAEPADEAGAAFARRLLAAVAESRMRDGRVVAADDQRVAGQPQPREPRRVGLDAPDAGHIVVVNLSDAPAQGRVPLPWPELASGVRQLEDLLSGARFDRDGASWPTRGSTSTCPPGASTCSRSAWCRRRLHPPDGRPDDVALGQRSSAGDVGRPDSRARGGAPSVGAIAARRVARPGLARCRRRGLVRLVRPHRRRVGAVHDPHGLVRVDHHGAGGAPPRAPDEAREPPSCS